MSTFLLGPLYRAQMDHVTPKWPESVSYQKTYGRAWPCLSYFWYDTDFLDFVIFFIFLKSRCHAKEKWWAHCTTLLVWHQILEFFSIFCHLKLVPYQKMDWRILPILLLVWQWLRPLGTFLCEAVHSVWDPDGSWKKYRKFCNKAAPLSNGSHPTPCFHAWHPN